MKTTADGHRCFSREFKIAAVRRVLAGEELKKVARDLDIRYDVLWKWKKRVVEKGEDYLYTVGRGKRQTGSGKNQSKARSIAELEGVIGRQQMEIRFLDKALRRVEELRQQKNDDGAGGIFEAMRQEMQMQGGGLTIREMCATAAVSRASYYRNWRKREAKEEEVALRDAIQRLALEGSTLWIPANREVAEARRLGRQSQAGVAVDASRQSVEHPAAPFRRDHR